MPETQPFAVITGASSGLGEVFARKLARRGWNLLLVARREDRLRVLERELEEERGVSVEICAADLAKSDEIAKVAAQIEQIPALELLVNNAGFGTKGYFWDVPVDRQIDMHQVHVMAVLQLSHAALQGMVRRNRGGIINVSSVAAYGRSPGAANYCATKGWINDISEGIYLDLKASGSKVIIQALCPGFTYTEFHDTLGASRDPIPKWMWLSADYVVEESLKALETGKLFVIPSLKYRLTASFLSKVPSALRLKLGARSPHSSTRTMR